MARYRKIDVRMWIDSTFRSLSKPQPNGRDCWIYLLTNPETSNIPGLYRAFEETLARGIGWASEGFREAFREVSRKGLVEADFEAGLVFIPGAVEYNPPESPNVIRGWKNTWDELPECRLKTKALTHIKTLVDTLPEGFREAFLEVFGKSMPNQEQEQEQDTDGPASQDIAQETMNFGDEPLLAVKSKKKVQKTSRAERTDAQAMLAKAYQTAWIDRFKPEDGQPPHLTNADWIVCAKIVKAYGLEPAIGYVNQYLNDSEEYLRVNGYPLRMIQTKINAYRSVPMTANAAAKPEQQLRPDALPGETAGEYLVRKSTERDFIENRIEFPTWYIRKYPERYKSLLGGN